jgi:hypothetical protein
VEFRHPSWWNETVFAAFRKTGTIFCSCSGPELPEDLVTTAEQVYIRKKCSVGRPSACGLENQFAEGEAAAVEAARRHGLSVAEVEGWSDRFLLERNSLHPRQKAQKIQTSLIEGHLYSAKK